MKFTVRGTDYWVYFKHHRPSVQQVVDPTHPPHLITALVPGRTECVIEVNESIVSRGLAFCHATDQWSPVVGRRFSFDRAVRGLAEGQDKLFRHEFWRAYLAAKGGKHVRP